MPTTDKFNTIKILIKIMILILPVCLILTCAFLFTQKLKIIGRVQLSDNPDSTFSNGGIIVNAGDVSTSTADNGMFVINAGYLSDRFLEVHFQKEGYYDKIIPISINWLFNLDTTIEENIGLVILYPLSSPYIEVEGFNNPSFPPTGWDADTVQGSYNWERGSLYKFEGTGSAVYPAYYAPSGSQARLISLPIYLGSSPVACSMKFYMYHDPDCSGPSIGPDSLKVERSTDGINFTRIEAFRRYEPGGEYWAQHTVNFGTLSGIIYIGFLGFSQYGKDIYIDYIRVFKGQEEILIKI